MTKKIAANAGPGIPRSLALARSRALRGLRYDLHIKLPRSETEPVTGKALVELELLEGGEIPPVDFSGRVTSIALDGEPVPFEARDALILLSKEAGSAGRHRLEIEFESKGAGLRRRDELVYSLFVPAKAHTVFPCYDQPDLKAVFAVELTVPGDWEVFGNSAEDSTRKNGDCKTVVLAETDLLPTYLFAFVAGRARKLVRSAGGRDFHILLPDQTASSTLSAKDSVQCNAGAHEVPEEANLNAIVKLHSTALDWLEEYTGTPYPFGRIGMVLIPDFEFGGMEHPGAVYYRREFLLPADSGLTRQLHRAHLIAHETAHMWFGNLVTMPWFDDVWLKEVFANHMADKIVAIQFPATDHELNSLLQHYPPAAAIDRTAGTHPVRQPLDCLAEAAELYDAIIYHKAPIAIQHLEDTIGQVAVRQSLREYLKQYAHGTASWPDLIEILERVSSHDIGEFSRVWIEAPGFPAPNQENGTQLNNVSANPGYATTHLDATSRYHALETLNKTEQPRQRAQSWLALFEDMLAGGTTPAELFTAGATAIGVESQPQLVERMAADLAETFWRYLTDSERINGGPVIERMLWARYKQEPGETNWLDMLSRLATTPESLAELRDIWRNHEFQGIDLPIAVQNRLALRLAIAKPDAAVELLGKQAKRLRFAGPAQAGAQSDDTRRFDLLCQAASPEAAVRDNCFRRLIDDDFPARWAIEALGLLSHPLRASHSIHFIEPGIRYAERIRDSGELFRPRQWLAGLLNGHNSERAASVIEDWLAGSNSAERFRHLVLQTADPVFRAGRLRRNATRERSACP